MKENSKTVRAYVPSLIERQAAQRPDAIALVTANGLLSYGELDSKASEVALRLRSMRVAADIPVGICTESAIAMVVAAFGVLKSGAAYLPLDPAQPPDRLSFMLRDAGTPVLLASPCRADCLGAAVECAVRLDEQGQILEPPVGETPTEPVHIEAAGLAYIMYTSGSTGAPKGVQITHRGLLNLVSWHCRTFGVRPGDRASQIASAGFDAAVWELWPYLAAGASVHVADETLRNDPAALRDWILSQRITISFMPTPIAERAIALDWPPAAPLRFVLTGGDTLHKYPPPNLPFTLINNYGPTECTVVATSGAVLPDENSCQPPSIGAPIAGARVYVLDENLNPAPAGTPGEIYIGGAGVARGYLRRPRLTAMNFIPDPFAAHPKESGVMYRTGDLGSWLPDGRLTFLGRIDDQIKIRGCRIEPQEIVTALNRHPAILQSAVIARESKIGEKQLAAYYVPASEPPADSELRAFLRNRLPDFMMPAVLVGVERLPLTHSGKLDRSALPEPVIENASVQESPETSPVEKEMAKLLATLLDVQRIGPEDNFFQLGGHSLLGAQVIAKVREVFGVELSLRSLFDHPTLRGMSAEIELLILEKLESESDGGAAPVIARPETAR